MKSFKSMADNENGATIVYVTVILALLMMFTALAVDVGYLYGVRNELQDAADAAALAGASVLFNDDASLNRDAALAEGARIAVANKTGKLPIAENRVETGHWSFTTNIFTANDATEQINWQGRSATELDLDVAFINAVKVRTDRSDTPSFFARILGFDSFFVSTDAVAYIGFAGSLAPLEATQPIAICEDAILDPEDPTRYSCEYGRMFNSGTSGNTGNSVGTAGWTNFTQPCETVGGSSEDRDLVCSGNPEIITPQTGIGATGGTVNPLFDALYNCWATTTGKNTAMKATLPVVDCEGQTNMPNCPKFVGTVELNIMWIEDRAVKNGANAWQDVPTSMSGEGIPSWTCPTGLSGYGCWEDFVKEYNLTMTTGQPPESPEDFQNMYQERTIYFLPRCEKQKPTGNPGGAPFGVPSDRPVLVE